MPTGKERRKAQAMEGAPAAYYRPWRRRRRRKSRRLLLLLAGLIAVFCLLHGRWRSASVPKPARIATSGAPGEMVRYPDPPGIVLHASESPAIIGGKRMDAAMLERIHAQDHPGWAMVFEGKTYHIGYHYVILPDGTIQQGRPDHCIGAHTRKHNTWIGICVIGAFSSISNPHWKPSRPSRRQIRSTVALCERLMSRYHIPPDKIKRHRDIRMTWCPGSRFPYPRIMNALREYAAVHPDTHPVDAPAMAMAPQAGKGPSRPRIN